MISFALDARSVAILNKLLGHSEHVSLNELARHINVSKRSIYYDLNKINEWLASYDLEPLKIERSLGIKLTQQQREILNPLLADFEIHYFAFQPHERVALIICSLLAQTEPQFIEDLSHLCDVSRNTTINDFKLVRTQLERYNLQLTYESHVGYRIDGTTITKRAVFLYYLETIFQMKSQGYDSILERFDFYDEVIFDHIMLRFKAIEKRLNTTYVEGVLQQLSILMHVVNSSELIVELEDVDMEEIMASFEYSVLKSVFKTLPYPEQIYFAMHLLGSRVQVPLRKPIDDNILELSQDIVSNFERIACVQFQNRDQLIDMLGHHLQMSIYRYRYGIQLGNPLIEEIRKSYADLFDITQKALLELKDKMAFPIPASEVAYITMHFGGFLKSQSDTSKARILIVCPSGISTAHMLQGEVESLHPSIEVIGIVAADEVNKYLNKADFIISTVDLNASIPTLRVNPIISEEDRMRILSKVVSENIHQKSLQTIITKTLKIVEPYVDADDFQLIKKEIEKTFYSVESQPSEQHSIRFRDAINLDHIVVVDKVPTWQHAIQLASNSLIQANRIEQSYVQAMIDSVNQYGPYIIITPKVALAHAIPNDNVHSLSLSLLKLAQPVLIDEEAVQIFIVLAPVDERSHLGILKDIMLLFNDKVFVKALFEAFDREQIMSLIEAHLA